MVARGHVPNPPYIGGQGLVPPTFPAENKTACGGQFGSAKEQLLHAGFTIGQPVAEKCNVTGERAIGWHGVMRFGIEAVVDACVAARAEALVLIADSRSASVG